MLRSLRGRWWRLVSRIEDEDGVTLIEVLIAGFVLTVAVLALASVASTSLASLRDARERDRATAAASSALESVRAMDYDEIAMRTDGDWASGDEDLVAQSGTDHLFDHDGDGTHTEHIWHTPAGRLSPYLCTSETEDCPFNPPADTRVSTRVFVTWYPGPTDQQGKRVTAVAVWEDPAFSQPRQVRMSTVISPASRGMPAPAFEVLPDFLSHTYDRVAVQTQHERCFDHTLNNFGARDSYDVVPGDTSDGWSPGTDSWTWTGTVGDRQVQWHFRAELQPSGVPDDDPDIEMAADGAQSLSSAFVLDTGDSARISFCYTPGEAQPPGNDDVFDWFAPRVRSQFDPGVFQDVEHRIDVEWDSFPLFLHHHPRVEDGIYARPIKTRDAVTLDDGDFPAVALFDQMPMNESLPPQLSSLPNYDLGFQYTSSGSEGGVSWEADATFQPETWPIRSGTFLPPSHVPISGLLDPLLPLTDLLEVNTEDLDEVAQPGELFAAEWDYQFPSEVAPLTLGGTSSLRLWASYDPGGSSPPPRSRDCLRAELVRNPGPDGGGTVVASGTLNAEARPNWIEREITLDWVGDTTFQTGDYLRLRVWVDGYVIGSLIYDDYRCVGTHIAYGAEVSAPEFVASLTSTVR